MHKELGRVQHSLPPAMVLICCALILAVSAPSLLAQIASTQNSSITKIGFEERLQFYLNQKSQNFLVDMAAKEKLLLQMVQNITAEIRIRGADAVLRNEPAFASVYGETENLIVAYSKEIDQVKQLIAEISDLKQLMEKERRYGMADLFASLRDSLASVVDDRSLNKKLPGTAGHVSDLLKEYDHEIDYFINFYNKLVNMEKAARRKNDLALLKKIASQKKRILQYIAISDTSKTDSLNSKLADAYLTEAQRAIEVLNELEKLEKKAAFQNPDYLTEIEMVRRNLLAKMDKRLLKMFGYREYAQLQGPTVTEVFHEWRSAQLAKFEAKYAEYLIIKKSLIRNANQRQLARMLQRDLSDALLNYADGDFLLAEMQLNKLIEDYGSYYAQFEAVYFYRAEAQYAQLFYEQAYHSYQELLQKYPKTQYRDEVYLRLLTIAQTLGWREKFYQRYQEFRQFANTDAKIRNRLNYLAGYYFLQLKDTKSAEEALTQIEKGSKYYLPGLYLTGLALANRGAYEGAIRIFNLLVNSDNLPWSDPNLALLKNKALLKIGYIHYDRGEYDEALKYLNRISRGADAGDKVLIGKAWAHMKNGQYEKAVHDVNELVENFLSSNYTYEALVLAAHSKRLINQPEEAMRDLRYVANARGVLDIADRYNEERKNILQQLDELEGMEATVLDNKDRRLYEIVSQIKFELQQRLLMLGYKGGIGSTVIQEFDAERQAIFRQLQELDNIIVAAKKMGNRNVLKKAIKRRQRLVKALVTYQADKSIDNVNYFLDYPLATRESSTKYRKQVLQEMLRDMELEKRRIQKSLQEARRLAKKPAKGDQAIDLIALKEDLESLQNRMDRFQTWLSENQVEEIQTDFDHWADFSGFGMSDITIQEMKKRENKISRYTQNVMFIKELMKRRRQELENRLSRFDTEMESIRKELEDEQIRLKKKEHEKIFEKLYFDTTTSETSQRKAVSKSSSDME